PSRYRFRLTLPGGSNLRAEQQADGAWAFFESGSAAPAFVMQPAEAYEQPSEAGERPLRAGHASMAVTKDGHGFVIDLAIDPAWLHNPARRFPVFLDPSFTMQPDTLDAYWHWGTTDG